MGSWGAIGCAVVYHARDAHVFSAQIKCRQCIFSAGLRENQVTKSATLIILTSLAPYLFIALYLPVYYTFMGTLHFQDIETMGTLPFQYNIYKYLSIKLHSYGHPTIPVDYIYMGSIILIGVHYFFSRSYFHGHPTISVL